MLPTEVKEALIAVQPPHVHFSTIGYASNNLARVRAIDIIIAKARITNPEAFR